MTEVELMWTDFMSHVIFGTQPNSVFRQCAKFDKEGDEMLNCGAQEEGMHCLLEKAGCID